MKLSNEASREQLFVCIKDLADRALELKQDNLASILVTVCASMMENKEHQLAYFTEAFSKLKIETESEYIINKLSK